MSFAGVVLYGPPASGKNTVTTALARLDSRFAPFERLRVSSTTKPGYRNISASQADALAADGQILYENSRYGNRYLVDRAEIERLMSAGLFPVVHLGQIDGVRAVVESGQWLTVQLQCARSTTLTRSRDRGDSDSQERAAVWDETAEDLLRNEAFSFGLTIDSNRVSARDAANRIAQEFFGHV